MSSEDWKDVYLEFLAQGLIGIMTSTLPTHTTSTRSLRQNPIAVGEIAIVVELVEAMEMKEQKKLQKPPVRQ